MNRLRLLPHRRLEHFGRLHAADLDEFYCILIELNFFGSSSGILRSSFSDTDFLINCCVIYYFWLRLDCGMICCYSCVGRM